MKFKAGDLVVGLHGTWKVGMVIEVYEYHGEQWYAIQVFGRNQPTRRYTALYGDAALMPYVGKDAIQWRPSESKA